MDAFHPSSRRIRQRSLRAVALLFLVCVGCRANCDLVEADLRAKEAQLGELQHLLGQRDCQVQALELEIAQLQRQCHPPVPGQPSPSGMVVKQIKLGRLTGGFDDDPLQCGDEGLQVLVEPRDCDDQSIKAPGTLHLEAFEITTQGLKVPLSSWDLAAPELRRTWDTPVFGGAAYRVTVPWKSWPMSDKLRIVAVFTTLDGQRFEADKDVTIRLAEGRRRAPVVETSGPHLPPPTEEPLRPPTPTVDPMPPAAPVIERPGEIAPASYVVPAAPVMRGRPESAPPIGLEQPVKSRWKPVR